MTPTKRLRIRKNIIGYVDYDYLDKLTHEERTILNKFTDEYYAGGYFKKDSLHKKSFDEKDYENLKQQMNLKMNAENRDLTAISGSSGYITNIDDVLEFISDDSIDKEAIQERLRTKSTQEILDELIEETNDLIKYNSTDDALRKSLLNSLCFKSIQLFILTKKEVQKEKRSKKQSK